MEQTSYKLINTRPRFAGIEFMHAVIICIVFVFLFYLTSSALLGVVVCSALYLVAKILIVRKPRHWLEDILSYHMGQKVYSAMPERRGE